MPAPPPPPPPQPLAALLEQAATLSLATVDAAGLPHAANVNFVADGRLDLYWLSSPQAAHSQHLTDHPDVALTAYTPFSSPADIRGVQLHGRATIVPSERFEELWPLFCRKFPYAEAMEERARTDRFYCFRPAWARLIDNSIRFGFKREWRLLDGRWSAADGN